MVPLTVPAQLSVVVGAVAVAEHSPVTLVSTGTAGGVSSVMITFWLAVEILPLPSSKLQWIIWVPWVEYVNGSVVVPVTVPAQLSVVVGAVTVTEHSAVML